MSHDPQRRGLKANQIRTDHYSLRKSQCPQVPFCLLITQIFFSRASCKFAQVFSAIDKTRVDQVVSTFKALLKKEWTKSKKPRGFKAAYLRAQALPDEDPERIFLETGFTAWLAYYLASPRAKHYKGRSANIRAIKTVKELTVELQREIAARVNDTTAHPTVTRTLLPPRSPTLPRLNSTTDLQQTQTIMNNALPSAPTDGSPTESTAVLVQNQTQVRQQQTVSNPFSSELMSTFPPYACGAIRKHTGRAAVTMVFP
ncbi:hypothetical protein AYL99_09941 [Fonsecaea erecta]|uniref:Uncharacterized protein n=1 Tax=Fonsecaea erecta TaxID=1367422 RepID=A0A178Z7N3_9EURO|nr:hypothetical protein AYL99_09941 [Fonsecaea erecta]OAP55789.1 hypothetical protein AYL99_09941 [Fonsecaea erecta]